MAKDFMALFNDNTGYEFEYLVLKSVDAEIKSETFVVNLLYPEGKEKHARENENKIVDGVIRALKLNAMVKVRLIKSHFDEYLFKRDLIKFSEKSPSVAPYVFFEDIRVLKTGEYEFVVEVLIDEDVINTSPFTKYQSEVKSMLASNYCESVSFKLVPKKIENKVDLLAVREQEVAEYVYQSNDGRFIVPQNVEEFVGKIIYDRAGYVCDINSVRESAVFCGTVSEFAECQTKKRTEDDIQRTFFKFTLTDPTGSLSCLFFPRRPGKTKEDKKFSKSQENIVMLKDGKQVVVKGNIVENSFRGTTTFDMFVRQISLCTIPEDLVIEKPQQKKFKENRDYGEVTPERYVEMKQASIFDTKTETPNYLMGKRFCVFDIETTGFESYCKIIEIGAVLVEDGNITEKFSTYVDPHEHISERITELTSITDADVSGAPDIEKVLGDFYKFSKGTILAGHNAQMFDLPFVNKEGAKFGINFKNELVDTFLLSKKYLKIKNYKLDTVAKHFDVVNEHAHRAIYDAITTAKVLIKLAEFIE